MTTATPSGKIGAKHVALIHIAKQQLGMDETTYRAVLLQHGRAESAAGLDRRGFAAVMRYFTACGFRSTWTKRTYGDRPGWASPKQIAMIRGLWRDWSGSDDEAALNRWIEHRFKVSSLRFCRPANAAKVITGLRAMVTRVQPLRSQKRRSGGRKVPAGPPPK